MCGISKVAGAAGGGPPAKVDHAAGHGSTGAPGQVAGASGGDAGKGAAMVKGGGGDAMSAALEGIKQAIEALKQAIEKLKGTMGGGGSTGCAHHGSGHVAGVQGGAATRAQYVARPVSIAQTRSVSAADREDDAFEQRVLELVNQERAKHGLAPVRYNAIVDAAAEKHAVHMAKVGKMAHDGIGDGDPGERIRAEGWRKAWGENVATGQTSAEQVVREWMNSPTHRRNILDPNFRNMGVGQVQAANGRTYWAQEFGA